MTDCPLCLDINTEEANNSMPNNLCNEHSDMYVKAKTIGIHAIPEYIRFIEAVNNLRL